jgi:hypothetical protein
LDREHGDRHRSHRDREREGEGERDRHGHGHDGDDGEGERRHKHSRRDETEEERRERKRAKKVKEKEKDRRREDRREGRKEGVNVVDDDEGMWIEKDIDAEVSDSRRHSRGRQCTYSVRTPWQTSLQPIPCPSNPTLLTPPAPPLPLSPPCPSPTSENHGCSTPARSLKVPIHEPDPTSRALPTSPHLEE